MSRARGKGLSNASFINQRRKAQGKHNAKKHKFKITPSSGSITHDHAWKTILILMIICPAALGLTNNNRPTINSIHGQPVRKLPADAECTQKARGISDGKVCTIDGTTTYLKTVPISDEIKLALASDSALQLSTQEKYNKEFITQMIDGRVPATLFYKEQTEKELVYIGSEKVEGIKFANVPGLPIPTDSKLGSRGTAKLAVAATMIRDLHRNNWGYDKQGLIFIDVDGANIPTKSLSDFLEIARIGITTYSAALRLYDVRQMRKTYCNMQTKPLPEHHDAHNLPREKFDALLKAYITACDHTIREMKAILPRKQLGKPSKEINTALSKHMKHQLSIQINLVEKSSFTPH